jgi:hypothetical protein
VSAHETARPAQADRLDQVVDRVQLERLSASVVRGEDPLAPRPACMLRRLDSIHFWHADVEQRNIRWRVATARSARHYGLPTQSSLQSSSSRGCGAWPAPVIGDGDA